jgi:Uma2 family endonuclease
MKIVEQARREGHVLLPHCDWQVYDTLLADPDVWHLRLTYDRDMLEIQARSFTHEHAHRTLRYVVDTLADVLQIPMMAAGMTTLRRKDLRCGLEPDASYYTRNLQAYMQVIREKAGELDLQTVQPPDLAIEVDDQTSTLDRVSIYARLGVPELWHRSGNQLWIRELQPDGTYRKSVNSPTFPGVPLADVMKILLRDREVSDPSLIRTLRHWIRDRSKGSV